MKLIKQKLSLSVIPVLRMSQEILKRRTEETLFEDVVITVAKGFPVCSAAPLPNHVAHPIPSGGKRDPRKWRSQLYMRAHQPFSSSSFQIVWNNLPSLQANYYSLFWPLCTINSIVLSLSFPCLILILKEMLFLIKSWKYWNGLKTCNRLGHKNPVIQLYLILIFRVFFLTWRPFTRFYKCWVMLSDLPIIFIENVLTMLPQSLCGPNISECPLKLMFFYAQF